ncbi:MAG: hypothetical protein IKG69_04915 [Atopobiaceae bacterium]|nr:hypothetical protein [Atopobiaceae bacterium]
MRKAHATLAVLAALVAPVILLVGCSKAPVEPLSRVYYSYGGGMLGGFSTVELVIHEDGSATLTTEEAAWHGDRITTRVYEVDAETVSRVRETVDGCRLWLASTRRDSGIQVLDGDTWHMTLRFGDESYSISQMQEISRAENEGVDAVLALLREACQTGPTSETLSPRKVMLATSEGYTYTFLVNDSLAADGLCDLLPLEAVPEARGTELVIALPEPLDVSDAPLAPGDDAVGTLLYRASTGELVIECAGYEAEDGLYELGAMEWRYADGLLDAAGGECSVWTYDYENMY